MANAINVYKDEKLILSFDSTQECSKVLGIPMSTITRCIKVNGKNRQTGYTFKYVEGDNVNGHYMLFKKGKFQGYFKHDELVKKGFRPFQIQKLIKTGEEFDGYSIDTRI